jgi:hypothetical protein
MNFLVFQMDNCRRFLQNSAFVPCPSYPSHIHCFTFNFMNFPWEEATLYECARPASRHLYYAQLTLSNPTLKLVWQYDFPVPLQCRKTSDTVFVAFVRRLSKPVQRFSSCSKDFSQQIVQVVYSFCFSMFFSFKTAG